MNKYNSRICYKHHSQGTFILIKFKEFIQKYWISITKLKQIDTWVSNLLELVVRFLENTDHLVNVHRN